MDGFPSLLLHCKALGLSPLCVLCNPKWTKLVSDLILSGCRVFDQCPCYDWIPSSVTLILVDGRVSSRLLSGFPSQVVVVSTGGSHRPISGWSSGSIIIRHDLVGGVTASRVFFSIFWSSGASVQATLPLPFVIPRDVSTVLVNRYTPAVRPPPPTGFVDPLSAVVVGRWGPRTVWHGRGLLPGVWSPKTAICVPAQPPRPGRWGLRDLSLLECWLAADVSENHGGLPWPVGEVCPGRCWAGVLFSLGHGGRFFHDTVLREEPINKVDEVGAQGTEALDYNEVEYSTKMICFQIYLSELTGKTGMIILMQMGMSIWMLRRMPSFVWYLKCWLNHRWI